MFNISDFLEKFKKFGQGKVLQTENIIKNIETATGIKLDKKNINVKDGVLRIVGSPALRQEIFLKKERLLPLVSPDGVYDIR